MVSPHASATSLGANSISIPTSLHSSPPGFHPGFAAAITSNANLAQRDPRSANLTASSSPSPNWSSSSRSIPVSGDPFPADASDRPPGSPAPEFPLLTATHAHATAHASPRRSTCPVAPCFSKYLAVPACPANSACSTGASGTHTHPSNPPPERWGRVPPASQPSPRRRATASRRPRAAATCTGVAAGCHSSDSGASRCENLEREERGRYPHRKESTRARSCARECCRKASCCEWSRDSTSSSGYAREASRARRRAKTVRERRSTTWSRSSGGAPRRKERGTRPRGAQAWVFGGGEAGSEGRTIRSDSVAGRWRMCPAGRHTGGRRGSERQSRLVSKRRSRSESHSDASSSSGGEFTASSSHSSNHQSATTPGQRCGAMAEVCRRLEVAARARYDLRSSTGRSSSSASTLSAGEACFGFFLARSGGTGDGVCLVSGPRAGEPGDFGDSTPWNVRSRGSDARSSRSEAARPGKNECDRETPGGSAPSDGKRPFIRREACREAPSPPPCDAARAGSPTAVGCAGVARSPAFAAAPESASGAADMGTIAAVSHSQFDRPRFPAQFVDGPRSRTPMFALPWG
ncbi:hypothetical protein DFJ74DRAFT_748660 [Hyaloraphidium curvatum]|nr:hypothetical protein DFJ74DRAFT_748660 [Hyaloraphidium curvatum]